VSKIDRVTYIVKKNQKDITMKRNLSVVALFVMLAMSGKGLAQNCEAIVTPYLTLHGYTQANYPADKFEYRCTFSQNAFYLCDSVPQDATTFPITMLTNLVEKAYVPANFVVDLNTFSYYAYNFMAFQKEDYHRTIYFVLGEGNAHHYLAVRCYDETMARTDYPEKYRK